MNTLTKTEAEEIIDAMLLEHGLKPHVLVWDAYMGMWSSKTFSVKNRKFLGWKWTNTEVSRAGLAYGHTFVALIKAVESELANLKVSQEVEAIEAMKIAIETDDIRRKHAGRVLYKELSK